MPGSLGGAVWMNARCYDHSVSDVLLETEILDDSLEPVPLPYKPEDFSYKKSPFQGRDWVILAARFKLYCRPDEDQRMEMARYRRDRIAKGHYRLPSAGSAFKNDYGYGQPMGRVIDQLGLRGFSVGGAKVADWHGNIIVNTGAATASDIRDLTRLLADKVMDALGLRAECEILFVGDWD
jgi:UDP-N-acetylmuramate dehydrogenase